MAVGLAIAAFDHPIRQAVAVQPHHRAEGAVLEPADQQLAESGRRRVAAGEAADIGGPPRNAAQPHVQAGTQLTAEILEGGVDVAAPHQRAVPLAAGPGTAHQVDDVLLALGLHTVIEQAGVHLGIDIAYLQVGADFVAVVVKLIHPIFRLGFIQPEQAHAVIIVVLFALFPHKFPGFGVGGVQKQAVAAKLHRDLHAVLGLDQHTLFLHFLEVLAAQVDLRPDGDHQLDPHFLQLLAHGLGIGEEFFVKAEVAHARPVEEVDDDYVNGKLALFVFPGDLQHLLLIPVAQLALPESQSVFGHHGHRAGRFGIGLFDLGGGIPGGHPVVQLLGAVGDPLGAVAAEGGAADGRIVPQEAVSAAGQHKRHAGLRIAVGQLEGAVLDIHHRLLVLPHAVQLFLRVTDKRGGQLVIAAENRLEAAGLQIQSAVPAQLPEQLFAVLIVIGDFRQHSLVLAENGLQLSAADTGTLFPDFNYGLYSGRRQQSIIGIQNLSHFYGPHPQTVFSPRLQPQDLAVKANHQGLTISLKNAHKICLLSFLVWCLLLFVILYSPAFSAGPFAVGSEYRAGQQHPDAEGPPG